MAFNEGFAATISFLTALSDPDGIARVLAETGGDLRRPNEATRMSEVVGRVTRKFHDDDPSNDGDELLRSALSSLTVVDVDPKPTDHNVMGMGMVPSRDPHLIGQVSCGTAYDLFVALYEQNVTAGKPPEAAIAAARDRVGALLLRSTRFVDEHSVSFEQWALAHVETNESAGSRTGCGARGRRVA